MMYINEIQEILPHRYPFLLVDRIVELKEEKVVGLKNVTMNEEFFQGHYPGHPIMPGVLIVESMAQVSGFLLMHSHSDLEDKIPLFAGIDKVRIRRPVIPGDTLKIEAEIIRARGRIAKVLANAYVEDKLVTEAELMFAFEDK
ncbi:3-hydroxyacyl-ACP dehydratase FabZ [Iocasia frigidifontis]|uniref:3-hydroxyacyl-[acyl-carrier-protein] dehydratase FabZ n=1 Tax=Iocasia fonsfrigidae TaxID=2682810 RepID=A0A8A7K9X6_9FIRM|nr:MULTISPECIES: 3-hydroxyacyl-ACP dehydratase FabZ [Halanaerobiaceae]AZO93968.1 3-hydroxyacyl-[acyl-carrier-protein] dehydratase FabZ [Halocella sp. SP3-1]QTL96895.1 3-hydroxyacyl-ACP dehydratase FabZ [Iocasia fonsfrigidae]